jgi:hypothetical protein
MLKKRYIAPNSARYIESDINSAAQLMNNLRAAAAIE